MKKQKKVIKKIPYVDYACGVGERVRWENLKGEKFEGILKKWDMGIAVILLDDGTEKNVKC